MKSFTQFKKATPILLIIVFLLIALPASIALGDSSGPNDAGLGTNVTGVGESAWSNPNNITVPTGVDYASVLLKKDLRVSNFLWASQYGFNLPLDATIVGIEVVINRQSSAHNPSIMDNVVRLVTTQGIVGENKANTSAWPISMAPATYGGPTDLWGFADWTPAVINSDDFGVALSALRQNQGNSDRTARVDYMQVTVYYEYASSVTIDCGGGNPVTMYGETINCVATVTHLGGTTTPTGLVTWTSDGAGAFVPNPCTLSGTNGVSSCSAVYTPTSVGSGVHLITANYSGDAFFSSRTVSQSVTVNPRPITVTADPQSKVYGVPDPELTYQVTTGSLVSGDAFTGALTRDPGEDVGTYAITQGTLMLTNDYVLTYAGDFLTITQAVPTCVITPYNVPYDAVPHTAVGLCTGVVGETLDGLDLSGTTHTDVGDYTDTWFFTDTSGNYANATDTINDVISPRAITVTADAKTKVFGQADPELTYQITSGSLLPGDAFTGALMRQPGERVGTYAILQGTLALPSYYALTYEAAYLTITGTVILFPVVHK